MLLSVLLQLSSCCPFRPSACCQLSLDSAKCSLFFPQLLGLLIYEGEELRVKEREQVGIQKGKGTRADKAVSALWKKAIEMTVMYFRLAKCRAVTVAHKQL